MANYEAQKLARRQEIEALHAKKKALASQLVDDPALFHQKKRRAVSSLDLRSSEEKNKLMSFCYVCFLLRLVFS